MSANSPREFVTIDFVSDFFSFAGLSNELSVFDAVRILPGNGSGLTYYISPTPSIASTYVLCMWCRGKSSLLSRSVSGYAKALGLPSTSIVTSPSRQTRPLPVGHRART